MSETEQPRFEYAYTVFLRGRVANSRYEKAKEKKKQNKQTKRKERVKTVMEE